MASRGSKTQRKRVLILVSSLIAIVIVVASLMVYGKLFVAQSVGNSASIKAVNVTVWQDSSCNVPLTSIDWGMLEPGESAIKIFYIKNEGNVALTLNMTIGSWSPSETSKYVTVIWDVEGSSIQKNQTTQADMTLLVSQNITGISNFTFTSTITGTG